MNIPAEFWKTLSDKEFLKVCETSQLDQTLTKRLWAMLGMKDKPPRKMAVFISATDVMREFPPVLRS